MNENKPTKQVESKIIVIRDTQVILDRDVAELYGVETRVVNQAVKRNSERFPEWYILQAHTGCICKLEITICDIKLGWCS